MAEILLFGAVGLLLGGAIIALILRLEALEEEDRWWGR